MTVLNRWGGVSLLKGTSRNLKFIITSSPNPVLRLDGTPPKSFIHIRSQLLSPEDLPVSYVLKVIDSDINFPFSFGTKKQVYKNFHDMIK